MKTVMNKRNVKSLMMMVTMKVVVTTTEIAAFDNDSDSDVDDEDNCEEYEDRGKDVDISRPAKI